MECVPGSSQGLVRRDIRAVVRGLEETALLWDFASQSQELTRLQSVRSRLVRASRELCGQGRQRALELQSDIAYVTARGGEQLDPLSSATGASSGPPAPSREELAQLVTEAQDWENDVPTMHRLLEPSGLYLPRAASRPTRLRATSDPADPAYTNLLVWPPDRTQAKSQFRFDF